MIKARATAEAKLRNINDFCASDGWFYRFRWRYNITKSVRLCGKAGEVNMYMMKEGKLKNLSVLYH